MDGQKPSPRDVYGAIGTVSSPLVFDVRYSAAFDADDPMLVAALRPVPGALGEWARTT
jgi:hypothetical protein